LYFVLGAWLRSYPWKRLSDKNKVQSTKRKNANLQTREDILASYEFITIWKVKAPQQQVWDLIFNSDRWPNWW